MGIRSLERWRRRRRIGLAWLVVAAPSVAFPHPLAPRPAARPPAGPAAPSPAAAWIRRNGPRGGVSGRRGAEADVKAAARHVPDGDPDGDGDDQAALRRRRRGMSLALTAAYFTVMAAKCALPATLSLLTAPETGLIFAASGGGAAMAGDPQRAFARILFASTSAVAAGKLLLGPVIDHFGGLASLRAALLALAALLGAIGRCRTVGAFAAYWVAVDFVFSSCWAACLGAVRQSFPPRDWARQVARLAAAARTGNAAAFVAFAWLLDRAGALAVRQPWRPVFVAAGLLQAVPLALLTVFGRQLPPRHAASPTVEKESSRRSVAAGPLRVLRREAATLEFWCHLLSRSLLMVFASFLLFVPTLMSQVYGTTSVTAAQVGSLYAVGCLLAVTAGSGRYDRLARRPRVTAVATMLGTATLSSLAQLGHVAGLWHLSPGAAAVTMFAWGLAFAVPFYIPPSLFALKRGGTESAATIADVFDIGGFGLLAVFNGYVAGIDHASPAAWVPVFQMTTAAAAAAMFALSIATWKEGE